MSGTGATGSSDSGSARGSVRSVATGTTGSLVSDLAFWLVGSVVGYRSDEFHGLGFIFQVPGSCFASC